MLDGCTRVGGRFTLFTVIVNDLSSFKLPSLARTVAPEVPASVNPGARCTFPVVASVFVTLMNAGPATFVKVRASPSGSLAVSAWSAVAPSSTVMLDGAVRVGGWFTLFTVIVNDLSSLKLPSLARTVAPKVPESVNPGAKWTFPVVSFVVETFMNAGPATFVKVRASASGSLALST